MKNKKHPLYATIEYIIGKKKSFLNLIDKHKTPFYAYDEAALDMSIDTFSNSFSKYIVNFESYYALKLNHHPYIIKKVIEKGMGLDVASKRELLMALKTPVKKIIYYSPGRSIDDFELAIKNSDRVRIHLDSFNELDQLGKISDLGTKKIEIGVRVNFSNQGDWKKYGIPLSSLSQFWDKSKKFNNLIINGVHFHQSRNKNSDFYVNAIKTLSHYLSDNFSKKMLKDLIYIDFGGGFETNLSEGLIIRKGREWPKYSINNADNIDKYAQKIGKAIDQYLEPLVSATYFSEPGRYISNNAMHIVLSVMDIKDEKNCILNGGVNMVGWQRFEFEYFPLINITNTGDRETKMNMWGNLCTTWDTWGYYVYGNKLLKGDCIIVPNQGALTYSLAQSFINEIPKVYKL